MPEAIRREFAGITYQALAALRQRIGQRIEYPPEPWCYEATRDNIRHYAHGIGDDNPLWCDPAYGKTTQYGDIIALPSFPLLRPAPNPKSNSALAWFFRRCRAAA